MRSAPDPGNVDRAWHLLHTLAPHRGLSCLQTPAVRIPHGSRLARHGGMERQTRAQFDAGTAERSPLHLFAHLQRSRLAGQVDRHLCRAVISAGCCPEPGRKHAWRGRGSSLSSAVPETVALASERAP